MILIIERNSQTFSDLFNGEGLQTSALTRYNVKHNEILNENKFIIIFEREYPSKVILNKWSSPQETPSFSNLQDVLNYINSKISEQQLKRKKNIADFTRQLNESIEKESIGEMIERSTRYVQHNTKQI